MNIHLNPANGNPVNMSGFVRQNTRNASRYGSWVNTQNSNDAARAAYSAKRMLTRDAEFNTVNSGNMAESGFSYGESIRNARMKAKETSLQLKKLRYDFKAISTQILQSKTSSSARQVVGKARREVLRLKLQRQNGEYDEEELQSAISHAQAMERVAKKKLRHLLEEEMSKAAGGPCAGELEEQERTEDELEEGAAESAAEQEEEAAREEISASLEDMMSDLMDEMSESMRKLLEESELSELEEGMFFAEAEMDPADLKEMKMKHRLEEMKDIVKADAEYLKALFDRLEKAKGEAGFSVNGGSTVTASPMASAPVAAINIVSAPEASLAAAAETGGGFDISV